MDIKKVDLLLKYILAAAGQEDYGNREVGPIHLVKYVYLADLAFAEKHGGETFTGTPWRFHHFGPWSPDVFNRIGPIVQAVGAQERSISTPKLEEDITRFSLVDEDLFEQLERELPLILTINVKRLIHLFGDDTTSLLHHVYRTRPMLEAAPEEFLTFKVETLEEESQSEVLSKASDVMTLYQTSSKKKRKADMNNLKEKIQAKLTEKKLQKQQIVMSKPPRYDDVFFEGVKWLDSLAGEPIQEQEGEISFSEDIWKSPARMVPDVS
ncbi:MAG: hypothetical protein ABSE95_13150 [Thermodesulfobacteriota bacterium]